MTQNSTSGRWDEQIYRCLYNPLHKVGHVFDGAGGETIRMSIVLVAVKTRVHLRAADRLHGCISDRTIYD